MAEGVATGWFADPHRLHGNTNGTLHKARIQVMSTFAMLFRIAPAAALDQALALPSGPSLPVQLPWFGSGRSRVA